MLQHDPDSRADVVCRPRTSQLARVTMETLPEMFGDTFVFCGHEYTVANAEFAAWVEPENEALQKLVRPVQHVPAAHGAVIADAIAHACVAGVTGEGGSSCTRQAPAYCSVHDR